MNRAYDMKYSIVFFSIVILFVVYTPNYIRELFDFVLYVSLYCVKSSNLSLSFVKYWIILTPLS